MLIAYIGSILILALITWLCLWVTKKGYSRKWDE